MRMRYSPRTVSLVVAVLSLPIYLRRQFQEIWFIETQNSAIAAFQEVSTRPKDATVTDAALPTAVSERDVPSLVVHNAEEMDENRTNSSFISIKDDGGNNSTVESEQQLRSNESVLLAESTSGSNISSAAAEEGNTLNTKSIPSCQPKGCLIFFIHIPKTGGSTFRDFVQPVLDRDYVVVKWRKAYGILSNRLKRWGTAGALPNNATYVVEIHDESAPSLEALVTKGDLAKWRNLYRSSGIPFFAFTVLRESAAFEISSFNHVCLNMHKKCWQNTTKTGRRISATSESLEAALVPNPQCTFLKRAGFPMHAQYDPRYNPTMEECRQVWEWMTEQLDWVGTLERLEDTLYLLQRIMFSNHSQLNATNLSRQKQVYLDPEQVDQPTKDMIANMTTLDTMLYDNARQHYNLSMWDLEARGT